jgi:predicted DNA-binding ribbon-helix-helix protein
MKKRSITLSGHRTSVRLEPEFWDAIERAARARGVSLASLIGGIDAARIENENAEGLASALRVFALLDASGAGGEAD